ncbi:MAG: hypothetical protein HDR75_03280 [Bacteroides sp.]|nr:hypothetical protein [Bacteroides sp.]
MTIQESLKNWAKDAVDVFNPLSQTTSTQFYLQSPLDQITAPVDTLVLGINPGSNGERSILSPEQFLEGNKNWEERFPSTEEGTHVSPKWAKYFGNGHFMLCGDQDRHNNSIDDNKKTVWSNLTPFATPEASKLSKDHLINGVPVTVELIQILNPKRIILLTTEGFDYIEKYANTNIERRPLVKDVTTNKIIEIGTIAGIPTIQLPHPSGNWGFPKHFLPMIVQLHKLHAVDDEIKPIEEVATKIKNQLRRIAVI